MLGPGRMLGAGTHINLAQHCLGWVGLSIGKHGQELKGTGMENAEAADRHQSDAEITAHMFYIWQNSGPGRRREFIAATNPATENMKSPSLYVL